MLLLHFALAAFLFLLCKALWITVLAWRVLYKYNLTYLLICLQCDIMKGERLSKSHLWPRIEPDTNNSVGYTTTRYVTVFNSSSCDLLLGVASVSWCQNISWKVKKRTVWNTNKSLNQNIEWLVHGPWMFRSKYRNTEQSSQQVKLSSPVKAVVYFRCILAHKCSKAQNTSALKPPSADGESVQRAEDGEGSACGRLDPSPSLNPPALPPSCWRHLSVCLQRDRNAVIRAQPERHYPSGSANSSGLELKRLELRADNELNAAGARCWRRRASASRNVSPCQRGETFYRPTSLPQTRRNHWILTPGFFFFLLFTLPSAFSLSFFHFSLFFSRLIFILYLFIICPSACSLPFSSLSSCLVWLPPWFCEWHHTDCSMTDALAASPVLGLLQAWLAFTAAAS